jgi:hypothetical protein
MSCLESRAVWGGPPLQWIRNPLEVEARETRVTGRPREMLLGCDATGGVELQFITVSCSQRLGNAGVTQSLFFEYRSVWHVVHSVSRAMHSASRFGLERTT